MSSNEKAYVSVSVLRHKENRASGPIRVLRIIARLNIGGPAIQAVSLTHELRGESYTSLLACGSVEPYEGDMSYLATEKGVIPTEIRGLGREISPKEDARVLLELIRLIRRFRPHIIHTHTAKAGALGRIAGIVCNLFSSRKDRARLIHTFHGHVFHSYFGRFKTAFFLGIEKFLAGFTDRIIVISPSQKADICRRYRIAPPEKVEVVRLGFELEAFSRDPEGCQKKRREFLGHERDGAFLVGIIGRLTPVKNHRMFLEGLKVLRDADEIGGLYFVIVGDGELRGELEEQALDYGLSRSVRFAGWQKDMTRVYGALDAVALTSLNEGTPVTLIEAMAAARPVISTRVGGVPDLMGALRERSEDGVECHDHGLLVPPNDPRAFAAAVSRMREGGGGVEKMGVRARDFVLSAYGMERLVKDIKGLYRDVMNKTGQNI